MNGIVADSQPDSDGIVGPNRLRRACALHSHQMSETWKLPRVTVNGGAYSSELASDLVEPSTWAALQQRNGNASIATLVKLVS